MGGKLGITLLLACGLTVAASSAMALQTTVTKVDKNADGSKTYHFAVKLDRDETMTPGSTPAGGDFVTVYNFYGLVEASVKSPPGWAFSSEASGRTPMLNGYPMVAPIDVPNTPNLTWTVTQPVAPGAQIEGFTATTRVAATVQGQYSAQTTRQAPAVAGSPMSETSRQALLGALPTPSFLAVQK